MEKQISFAVNEWNGKKKQTKREKFLAQMEELVPWKRLEVIGPVKSIPQLKKPFGTARMVDITHARYLSWEDAFDVEFADGLSFLEPHATIRKANRISTRAKPVEVVLDEETHGGFEVRYDTGEVGEISWAFVRELPPKRNGRK